MLQYLATYYEGNPNSLGTCCIWSRLCDSEAEAKEVIAKGFRGRIFYSPDGWEKTKWGDYLNLTTKRLVIL